MWDFGFSPLASPNLRTEIKSENSEIENSKSEIRKYVRNHGSNQVREIDH